MRNTASIFAAAALVANWLPSLSLACNFPASGGGIPRFRGYRKGRPRGRHSHRSHQR